MVPFYMTLLSDITKVTSFSLLLMWLFCYDVEVSLDLVYYTAINIVFNILEGYKSLYDLEV